MREPSEDDAGVPAWRDAYARIQVEGSDACPSDERLASLALGELVGAERSELTGHVVSCKRCSLATRDLLDLRRESERGLPRPRRRRWPRWRIAVAAAAVVSVVGIPILLRRAGPSAPATPSFPRGQAEATGAIEPPDRATLPIAPAVLRWPKEAGADGYQAVLYDAEATPFWESPVVVEPEVEIPASVRAALRAGSHYYWRTTTIAGIDRRSSPLRRFHLAP
jgi:hypothetical protein